MGGLFLGPAPSFSARPCHLGVRYLCRSMSVEKVAALLGRYGQDTVCSQALEPGLCYWFSRDGDACVAYADVGGAWVAAGGPICEPERRGEVMQNFSDAASGSGARARFFATEEQANGFRSVPIGEQAEWVPGEWSATLRSKRSLREQLRRARAKGVCVRGASARDVCDESGALHTQVRRMVRDWQESRQMAPMHFLVTIDVFGNRDEKRYFVAERCGEVLGILVAARIPKRNGWFFENLLRSHDAPNGTTELLFDCAMRHATDEDIAVVSFGLAPLAGDVSAWLRAVRDHSRWLYDFEGLRAFKAKLRPTRWRPIYLSFPENERGLHATIDSLTAFAGGSWIRFGLQTLAHAHATLVWWFAFLLIPWTVLLSRGEATLWFPSESIRAAWVAFDMLLFVGLLNLSLQFRKSLAYGLAAMAACDAAVGIAQLALFNRHTLTTVSQWGVALLAIAAPLGAALILALGATIRESLYLGVDE